MTSYRLPKIEVIFDIFNRTDKTKFYFIWIGSGFEWIFVEYSWRYRVTNCNEACENIFWTPTFFVLSGLAVLAVSINTLSSSLSCGYFPTMILVREKREIEEGRSFDTDWQSVSPDFFCLLRLLTRYESFIAVWTRIGVRNWFDFKRCWLDFLAFTVTMSKKLSRDYW